MLYDGTVEPLFMKVSSSSATSSDFRDAPTYVRIVLVEVKLHVGVVSTTSFDIVAPSGISDIVDDLARFVLGPLDVRFPKGLLSLISGPTGSGKSALLNALLGGKYGRCLGCEILNSSAHRDDLQLGQGFT